MDRDQLWQPQFDFFRQEAPDESEYLGQVRSLGELERRARQCSRCGLRRGCRNVVFGEGPPDAVVMMVGEGPGAAEDAQGRPFVGPAGQLLDRILTAAGFRRSEVYITNVVMCRPPFNRLPQAPEVEACLPFLRAKIRLIRPRIVVCLGALATQTLIDPRARITRVRGQWSERDGVLYLPTYHPAALLRDERKKRPVWEDFKKLRETYERLVG